MSEEKAQEIIIVRRRVESEEGHHGGAWKIAYADFVTAMMAFFLVLWILNSTNKDSQTIIARYFNPVKMEDFAKNKKGIRDQQQKEEKPGLADGEPNKAPPAGEQQGRNEERGRDPSKDLAARAPMNDETLFQNPYAALDQIAGKAQELRKGKDGASSGQAGGLDAFHDPFRAPAPDVEAEDEAETPPPPKKETPDAPKPDAPKPDAPKPDAPKSAETKSAEIKPAVAEARPNQRPPAAASAKAAADAAEKEKAAALQQDLVKAAKAEAGDAGPRVEVVSTPEGTLISLTDKESFGMFEVGSSSPNPKLVHLMERVAQSLKDQPGAFVLRGYTDARRYKNGASDNWRLSASRAQMALYMLARGGLPESRVERVEGYADRHLKNPQRPDAAENRRIEILLRKAAP
jgi:chemotaxis protein MotB